MKLVMMLSRDDLSRLGIQVIVECWDHKNRSGRVRRAYYNEFNEHERAVLGGFYPIFYRWIMRTGFPKEFPIRKVETIELIKKAANFFGTI